MTDRTGANPAPAQAEAEADDEAYSGLIPQMRMMLSALLASPVRNTLFMLGGALVLVIIATTYGQIRLNNWNQPFYDALSRRDLDGFLHQLSLFGVITGGLLILNVGQKWLNETVKLKLREGLAKDLIRNWLQP